MNEHELKQMFKNTLDRQLTDLNSDPLLAQRILRNIERKKEIKVKKKFSMSLVFALITLIVMATAWAAGSLIFSSRYDTVKVANQALHDNYGITDKMMSQFYREVQTNSDGSTTVTYESVEHIKRLGIYTIIVKGGKAEASWSLDGSDITGGLEALAWGPEQINLLLTDYPAVMRYLSENSQSAQKGPIPPPPDMEETKEKYEKLKTQALEVANLSLDEAKENAILALEKEYQLTKEQVTLLESFEGDETYDIKDDKPLISLYIYLDQSGEEWKEKDGIYVVTIDMIDGSIEDIFYDSSLGGNG